MKSNKDATMSFFGEIFLPGDFRDSLDTCDSLDEEINKLPLTQWENMNFFDLLTFYILYQSVVFIPGSICVKN